MRKIIQLPGLNPDVIKLISPFAMHPDVIREMKGYPILTNGHMRWFISMKGSRVAGFGAIEMKKDHVVFTNDYTVEQMRHSGIHSKLISERLEHCKEIEVNKVIADCTKMSVGNYLKHGFRIVKEFKEWTKVEIEL